MYRYELYSNCFKFTRKLQNYIYYIDIILNLLKDFIAFVLGALVSLLTLEPNEYGPSGQINMKVVKTLVPVDADTVKEDSSE